MSLTRIVVVLLTCSLAVLLALAIRAGLGNMRLFVIMGGGIALGILYAIMGRLPNWMVEHSGGFIAADDDPDNISPRIYLPILFTVIVLAIVGFGVGLWWLG